jgi:DNA-binding GntR family transcriptional regulator
MSDTTNKDAMPPSLGTSHAVRPGTEKLARPKSLTALAMERIRASIVEGRLAFGEQLSEAALAHELGISKTPVREALLRLKLDGLVDVHPQRGTFVFQLNEDEVAELSRFRAILEAAALAEGMRVGRAALAGRLDAVVREMAEAHRHRDRVRLPDLDAAFHGAIVDQCGNPYLRSAYSLVEHKIHALRWRLPENDGQVEHCQANHAVIAQQVRKGTVARAQALLVQHIRETCDAYAHASSVAPASTRRRA